MFEKMQQGNIAKGQKTEQDKCGCENTLKANDICILETHEERKLAGKTCEEKSTRKQSLRINQGLNPTKLDEMINNSIKEVIQTIVKHYSMEKPKEKSRAFQSHTEGEEEKRWKNPSTVRDNRRATRYFSRRHKSLLACSDPYPYAETLECMTPLSAKNKNKKRGRAASNVNTDNRRMTGNVNIYICSEANDNDQAKSKQKLKAQTCMDASSDASTEPQLNSRCISGNSESLCKLINGTRKKQKNVQPSNFVQDKREKRNNNGDIVVRDAETWRTTETSDSNEDGCQMNVKLSDQEECNDTVVLSARDVFSCGDDTNSSSRETTTSLCQDSLNSVALSYDSSQASSSWIAIYPSKARYRFDSDDTELSSIKRKKDRKNFRGITDSECTVCDDAIDGKRRLLKSAYANCLHADDSKYRDMRFRDSILKRRYIRERRTGYKVPVGCSQGQQRAARQRSVCSCIAEEGEENHCTNVDGMSDCTNDEGELPENLCPTQVICNESARGATVRVTSLNDAEGRFEETLICKDGSCISECPRATTACGATFGNSQKPLKITRVSNTLVVDEIPRDTSRVCETIFAKPNGPMEEETIGEAADLREKPDSKAPNEAPKETTCKIPDSNFADRDDVERISASDAKDKLTKEKIDNINFNNRNKRNVVNAKNVTVQSDDNVIPDLHFDRQQSAKHERESVSIGTIRDFISKDQVSTKSPHAVQPRGRPNYSSNSNTKETNLVDREKSVRLSALLRPMWSRFQSSTTLPKDPVEQDFTTTESKQSKEKVAKEESSSDKIGPLERSPKDTYRSLKRLLNVIRQHKSIRRIKDGKGRWEENRNDSVKRMKHDKEDEYTKPKSISKRVVKINDYEKDRRDVGAEMYKPARPPLANKRETGENTVFVKRQEPMALTTDVTTLSRGDEKADISDTSQTAQMLKPKLLRIIAAKRSHLRPIETITDPKSRETKVVSDEMSRSESVDRGEDLVKPISTKVSENTIAVESIVRDDASKVIADIPNENGVSGIVVDETTDSPRKKVEEKSRKAIPCECGIPFEPNSGLRLVTERTECNDPLEDCFWKHKQSEMKEEGCIRAPIIQYPKSRFGIDKLISPVSESLCVCTNYCGKGKESEYRQIIESQMKEESVTRLHRCRYDEECGCGTCECRYSPDRSNKVPTSRVDCNRRKDKHCRDTEIGRNCKKPMICLYCDNPQDKCTCRAPIGKCRRCELPLDVCDCQNGQGHDRDRKCVAGNANKGGSIRVTSWRPKREIRRYFARNGPGAANDCRCYEKLKRQRPEELPYQRLNVFSDVMNELQKKMSESVLRCTRCRRNPCCCCGEGSRVNLDEGKERRRVEDYVRCPKAEKARRKSSNDRGDESNSKDECDGSIVETLIPIRRVGRAYESSVCGCGKSIAIYERSLAKCYYCKSLPCT